MVVDILNQQSFENAKTWKEQVDSHTMIENLNLPKILAVNKVDLIEDQHGVGLEPF